MSFFSFPSSIFFSQPLPRFGRAGSRIAKPRALAKKTAMARRAAASLAVAARGLILSLILAICFDACDDEEKKSTPLSLSSSHTHTTKLSKPSFVQGKKKLLLLRASPRLLEKQQGEFLSLGSVRFYRTI